MRRLWARYCRDGRLPPVVSALVRDAAALRARDRIDRLLAAIRPVLAVPGSTDLVTRRDGRRIAVAGPAAMSSQALTHDIGQRVTAALTTGGVDMFLVDRDGEHLVFGILDESRRRAWDALQELAGETAWYVGWVRGGRRGTVAVRRGSLPGQLLRSTTWSIYRAWASGDVVIGPEQATQLTFWELGTSGKHEMIGVRGQARFDIRSTPTVETIDGHDYTGRSAFPVGNGLERFVGDIDVVYTWVDGSDEQWRAAFDGWSAREGRDHQVDRDLVAGRYRDNDELRHSLRSLWFGCDWVRRIFIVTAAQVPAWLDTDDERVEVVLHRNILPETGLPTFNSHAIEAALHRIEGLAEHFVYFNDDVFVGRPLRPDHFFTSSGLPKVFPSDARVSGVDDDRQLALDNAAMRGRQLLARDFGRVAAFKPHHAPFALRRTLLEEITKRYADEVEATMHRRFRHPDDLSIPASLAGSYGIATGQAVTGSLSVEYVHLESARLRWHLDRLRLGRRFDTFCLNETETETTDRDRSATSIADFLARYFPVPAPWERGEPSP
jgi:Stealth protein CR2, conserved region 2/Stealth protein CR3, conserved region 3/Stealth protein CR1, conserved region 1/Stealth protein CR4, conserved region 4